MTTATRKVQLLDQQLALSAYLDAMLQEQSLPIESRAAVQAAASVSVEKTPAAEQPGMEKIPPGAGVPVWATVPFQVLLFKVAGLTLAVPLIKLKGVMPNEAEMTPMPGHSPLFLGIVPYQGCKAKVVDTARFILPQGSAQLDADGAGRSAHLVMIDEGRWALACDSIGEVIELEEKDVKWRSANSKRAWLAGTVIEQMCALLDIDALTRNLVDGLA
ncbi:MAG TPA: chemotaxis protein CheW [Gammaproteobacteria bacterium]|nr:chemotaxis protein CheW [Gammaproteobacteria bacterium]